MSKGFFTPGVFQAFNKLVHMKSLGERRELVFFHQIPFFTENENALGNTTV